MRTRVWKCDSCGETETTERKPQYWVSYNCNANGVKIPGTTLPVKGDICHACLEYLAKRKIVKAPNG